MTINIGEQLTKELAMISCMNKIQQTRNILYANAIDRTGLTDDTISFYLTEAIDRLTQLKKELGL